MTVVDERTQKKLQEILEAIDKRKETFESAIIGLALSKNKENEWRVCFGIIDFQRKGETPIHETKYDYGEFVLIRKTEKIQAALDLASSIFEKQTLKFGDYPEIPLKASMGEVRFLSSRTRYGRFSSEWPMLYAYARIDDSAKGAMPSDSLSKLGLPLFPSGVEAVDSLLELNLPEDWHTIESEIEFRVPDYRARIRYLRLAGKKITLEVETGSIAQTDLRAKFYCKGIDRSYTSDDIPIENGQAVFTADEEPFLVEAHILSAQEGDSIDGKKFDYRYPSREEQVVIEDSEERLLDMISRGENEHVEFKKELDSREFLETVAAFANTYGGSIFLGVDDNCRICGFKEDAEDKIVDMIADSCDPSIDVQIHQEVLHEIPVTIVEIPEGTNKPYVLNNRGIFIRRGASDRQIKRTELDDVYAKKQQRPSSW
ncbi:MAG TPA: ATP-binding protein [Candidatus Bathyarchaeia archaeon]|nr:ATP-binding protein [Candidatus Bathyarchaeia archaeon]